MGCSSRGTLYKRMSRWREVVNRIDNLERVMTE